MGRLPPRSSTAIAIVLLLSRPKVKRLAHLLFSPVSEEPLEDAGQHNRMCLDRLGDLQRSEGGFHWASKAAAFAEEALACLVNERIAEARRRRNA